MDRTERPPRIRASPAMLYLPMRQAHAGHAQFYALYLRLFYSATVTKQRTLKSEILLNKKELLQTSAQDQFAKWAKLRRSVDKGLADLEKLSEYLIASLAHRITLQRTCGHPPTTVFSHLSIMLSLGHPNGTLTLPLSLPPRRRAIVRADVLLAQVQLGAVGDDDGPAVRHRLVVPQVRGVLPAPGLVRAHDVVARAALCARGLRELRGVADGVQAGDQGGRARREGRDGRPRAG